MSHAVVHSTPTHATCTCGLIFGRFDGLFSGLRNLVAHVEQETAA